MLKPAQLYKDELHQKTLEIFHNEKYMYFYGDSGYNTFEIPNDTTDQHFFCSVNENNEVLGFICYEVNRASQSAYGFGAISFVEGGSVEFARDLKQAVFDIFLKYGLNRMEWGCFVDNPAIRGYRKFIKRYGGKECGYRRQANILMDGKLHDSVTFEILREEFKPWIERKEKE